METTKSTSVPTDMTISDVRSRLAELKKIYCPDMYWTHKDGDTSAPYDATTTPCGTDGYVCNVFDGYSQCYGFANYMAYQMLGYYPNVNENNMPANSIYELNGWTVYTGEKCRDISLNCGDIIRANGHSAIVVSVYPDIDVRDNGYVIEVAEVWGSVECQIAWGHFNGGSKGQTIYEPQLTAIATYIAKPILYPTSPETGTYTGITFDPCGGICSVESKSVLFGDKLGTLPVPTKDGYTFAGWWDEQYVEYIEYTSETIAKSKDTITLYAHWAKNYKITNAHTGTCLNVYGENVTSLSDGVNVTLWTDSGTDEQKWTISGLNRKRYIRSPIDKNYGLNVYRAGSPYNCNIHKISGNEVDARMDIFKYGNTGYYKIKPTNYSELYLTGDSAHGNVYWDFATGDDTQLWEIDEV